MSLFKVVRLITVCRLLTDDGWLRHMTSRPAQFVPTICLTQDFFL